MKRLAEWMRKWADRMDPDGAPRYIGFSYTFERYRGIVFREDGRGCRLWYLGEKDHDRAWADSGNLPEKAWLHVET
jgi:hypothetical protein